MPNMNVTIIREEEEIELDVEFDLEPADPSVGIFCWSAAPHRATTDRGVQLDLTDKEWDRITTYIEENYEEDYDPIEDEREPEHD
jgi:hypothetical protein